MSNASKSKGQALSGPRRSLKSDCGGAVMVLGVFMAAFLVGALWYIIGFGDALLYRERMQDGADAVAYASAVYHARGMNIIAMLNLIMAAILAVLVALKICLLLLTLTNYISCIICDIPYQQWACPICAASGVAKAYVESVTDAVEEFCDVALPALSKTQKVVAVTMPWIAEARAISVAQQYSKPVEGGVMLSSTLVPSGDRLGLPVQEDTFKELCRRAGMTVGEVVMIPFGVFGVDTRWAAGLVGSLVSSYPGYFCGDSGSSGGGSNSGCNTGCNSSEDSAQQICNAKKDSWNQKYHGKKLFDMGECMKDEKKNAGKNLGNLGQGQMSDTSGKTPKKVYDSAKNGNDYFQIWSVVWGDQTRLKEGGQGVGVAAWKKAKPKDAPAWTKLSFAQAEFYYDAKGSWDSLKEDALWNMRWRARLRRVRPPSQLSGALDLVGALSSMAGSLNLGNVTQILNGGLLGGSGWESLLDGGAWGNLLKNEIPAGDPGNTGSLPSGYSSIPSFQGIQVIH